MNRSNLKLILGIVGGFLAASGVIYAAQTNYLGTVFIADPTTLTNQLKINSDGSINVSSEGSDTVLANQGAAGTSPWLFALPSGASTSANQTSQITQETATATGIGTPADTAYAGSGNSSTIAALKGIYNLLVGTLSSTLIPSATGTAGITPVVSAAAEGSHVLKASAGNLYGLIVTSGTTAGYVMVFNATTAPADGAVTPLECSFLPANGTVSISADGSVPAQFSTGITAVFSSTGCFTKTASATAFFSGQVK